MAEKITCVSPVDGSVYASRPVASKKQIAATFAAAHAAQEKWKRRAAGRAGRVLLGGRGCDGRHEGRDRAGAGLADGPAGALWRGRSARLRGARPLHDRHRRAGARRHLSRPQGRLRALRQARPGRRGLHDRAVELSLSHRRQLDHPGADGGQHGGAEARGLDAAGGASGSRSVRPGQAAEGRVPAPRAQPPADGRDHCRRPGRTWCASPGRWRGGRPWRRRRPGASSMWGSSSAARTRPTCGPTPTWPTPSRTWSTAPSSIPGRAAAPSSASTSTSRCGAISSMASSISRRSTCWARRSTRRRRSAPWCAPRRRRSSGSRSRRP